ncbi:MAG TPA: chromosomal replication initiator protein DnaA [Candidatus Pullichristensenella stercoripullorum]|nr:chromosomal replication initiator protein DnaA [Candidatus Pullichristensenella stercoripullorum]
MHYTEEQLAAFEKAISMFKGDVNDLLFKAWFSRLKLFTVTEEAIVIEAENSMVVEQLRARYFQTLSNVLGATFGRTYDIKILTAEEIKNQYREMESAMLDPHYTFENFVVGSSNSFAHAAALAVADDPSGAYNPLFIYGGVGLGKTHLMNAIGNYVQKNDPRKNVLFITSETFTNELIDAIVKKKGTAQLRAKMRNVDVLLVDDIQFLSKTVSTQEEFFHTFNHLYAGGKQIILSSDRPPKDIPTIEERLRSRFEWGLTVDIQRPDFETRVAILQKKCSDEDIDTPTEVLEYIAERVESNIRELEGMLVRVNAQAQLMGKPITLEMAQETLAALLSSREPRKITPDSIIQTVSSHYSVSNEDVTGKRRSRDIALPRQVSMYLIRELTPLSTTAIGRVFSGRDHSTVMHSCDKIAEMMRKDISFRKTVDELKQFVIDR